MSHSPPSRLRVPPGIPGAQTVVAAHAFAERLYGDRRCSESGRLVMDHAVEVANLVLDCGADASTALAAMMHETVDCGAMEPVRLGTVFGERIRDLVVGQSVSAAPQRWGGSMMGRRMALCEMIRETTVGDSVLLAVCDRADQIADLRRRLPADDGLQVHLRVDPSPLGFAAAVADACRMFADRNSRRTQAIISPFLLPRIEEMAARVDDDLAWTCRSVFEDGQTPADLLSDFYMTANMLTGRRRPGRRPSAA